MKTRVAVLGCNGVIGRSLVNLLLARGGVTLTCFGRKSVFDRSDVRYISGLIEDPVAVSECLRGQETVFHLISQTIPSSSWTDPVSDVELNLLPSIRLFEAAASAGVKRIVFASSGGTVYGHQNNALDEYTRTEPFSPYGIVKRSIESFLQYARARHGIDYDIYRISNVYGEGLDISKGLGFINTALELMIRKQPIPIYGDGETIRDYIHVEDVARFMATSVGREAGNSRVFNVSSNRPVSLNQLLTMIREVTGAECLTQYLPARASDNEKVLIDSSSILSETGITDLVPLGAGILRTYEFLRSRIEHIEKPV
ncbi:MAG: NAD-dependent epimerase/dehydratase family protein [Acidobacteriota bacterium]